jgi:HAD superfamily phosphoserine phosphatase-like hydrolase
MLPLASILRSEGLKRVFLSFLWRLQESEVDQLARDFARQWLPSRAWPEMLEKIAWHKQRGDLTVLVSASPEPYVREIGRLLGFHHALGTVIDFPAAGLPLFPDLVNNKGGNKVLRLRELLRSSYFTEDGKLREAHGYSDSAADMGNSTDEEFADHYAFLVREKFRVTKPGRLTAVHCSDLPMTKWKDGAVGIKDFSGQIIRIHEDAGWILHGRRTIWKDPVVEMTRTKHVGLLYKQLQKDSAKSRGGMPDYLMTFVRPGENAEPIAHTPATFSLPQWQEWASPVWMTVRQTNVLNVRSAKEAQDERHLCPLQLDVIERAVIMWSNQGDVILSPFMGIGSEGVEALKHKRRFLGVELKESYWRQACRHLATAEASARSLFDAVSAA